MGLGAAYLTKIDNYTSADSLRRLRLRVFRQMMIPLCL